MRMRGVTAVLTVLAGAEAAAQGFTTAAEVRPILEATRGMWVALRPWEGAELLYFTHLESWRCGIDEIRYAVNDGEEVVWPVEPCFEGTAAPNALGPDRLPFTRLPSDLVQTVAVTVILDDGSAMTAAFDRAAILMR